MKDKNKLSEILSCVIAIVVYSFLGAAAMVEIKWVYALILPAAIVLLYLLRKERFNILKLWAIIMLIHSVFVLAGWSTADILKKSNNNLFAAIYGTMVRLFASYSGKIIVFIWVLGYIFIQPIVKAYRIALADVIYGPLPNVRGIVKRNRKVYFFDNYDAKQVQVIFRNGSKKKILDAYEVEGFFNSKDHFSLEWEEEKEVVVRKYNAYNHELIMEKKYKVPKY